MDFTESADARKRCRNPLCRSKLAEPVINEKEAFCTRGCYRSFYLHRCIACEERIERKAERQRICGKAKCRNALRVGNGLGRYYPSTRAFYPTKTPIKSRLKTRHEIGRAATDLDWAITANRAPLSWVAPPAVPEPSRAWRTVAAAGPAPANVLHCAAVGAGASIVDADRINENHWKAAKAGERGYRRPDRRPRRDQAPAMAMSPRPSPLDLIPDDLSIPAFLRRVS